MRLTTIGCSGTIPGPNGPASCYLVEVDDFRLILDLGSGAIGALQRFIDIDEIDAVVLSHLHVDHCVDLLALYVARLYGGYNASRRLPVLGPSTSADRMADMYGLRRSSGMHSTFEFQDLALATSVGPFEIRTARVAHPVEAYAVRVEADGASLVYSGDTGPTLALNELADGADAFLCEATFSEDGDHPTDLHLTGKEAGEAATAAGVGRLILTHIPPWNEAEDTLKAAQSAFSGPVALATSGESVVIGR